MKKGPNGVDYEYEYVYYYYDDDEKDGKKTTTAASEEKETVHTGGKNRYTSVDRSSSTAKPLPERNEIPSSRGKGRQVIPVVEEIVEERLPANTRFPPRNSASITPSVSVISTIDETTKKISVKRPSLELVDSQSFNRGDKTLTKGSRVIENEYTKSSEPKDKSVIPLSTTTVSDASESSPVSSTTTTLTSTASNDESTTIAQELADLTTQIMDRVALDLYAHLVNENSIADATTTTDDNDDLGTTDSSGSTLSTDEYTTWIPSSKAITTTTTTEATTTTTTTTTEAPVLINGRKSPFGSGRNRFNRLKPSSTPATENSAEKKDAVTESSALKPKSMLKPH